MMMTLDIWLLNPGIHGFKGWIDLTAADDWKRIHLVPDCQEHSISPTSPGESEIGADIHAAAVTL